MQAAHPDFPLYELDGTKIDELLSYWRNRPVSPKTKKAISYDDARHKLNCFWALLNWLDQNERWKWHLPNRKFWKIPERRDEDRVKSRTRRVSKGTYGPKQLAVIAAVLILCDPVLMPVDLYQRYQVVALIR